MESPSLCSTHIFAMLEVKVDGIYIPTNGGLAQAWSIRVYSQCCQSYRIPPTLCPALISKVYSSKHATQALYALNIVFQMQLLRISARSMSMMTYINPVPASCQNEATSWVVQWSGVFLYTFWLEESRTLVFFSVTLQKLVVVSCIPYSP